MKIRLKKQNRHEAETVHPTGIQAKSLTDIRPMDNPLATPQKPQTEDAKNPKTETGFNWAQIPIFADGAPAAAPKIQPKIFPGDRSENITQQPVQRDEEPMQGKLEPVQREEDEEPMQGKLEPVQREEDEEPMQQKQETVQREEDEEPMQGKLEPVQREEDEEPMQQKQETDPKQPVQPKINLAPSGSGKSMPEPVQQKMEGAFGVDFSGVRIHEGPQAKAINAVAYTQGSDIHFQPGKYQPDTQSGQELLGHELTHVVQQKAGRVKVPQGKGVPINTDLKLETEADILGAKAARGDGVQVAGASSSLQRKSIENISEQRRLMPLELGIERGLINRRLSR